MPSLDINTMARKYREVRKAVYQEATRPRSESPVEHDANRRQFKEKLKWICHRANLERYRGLDPGIANVIWHLLWTTNRYAGISSDIASREIRDIADIFDRFELFSNPSWDFELKGPDVVRAGSDAQHFRNRTGLFQGKQTIGKKSKLRTIVEVARKLKRFLDTRSPDTPILDFITAGQTDVWCVHRHLLEIGYKADLTALHFMMELGFPVIKPDVVLTRLFLHWGWLHEAIPELPNDVGADDLQGNGKYGSRFKYTKPIIYKPAIELARRIVQLTDRNDLVADIGWVSDNPLREFDLFIVKSGQQLEDGWGLVRVLHKGETPSKKSRKRCLVHELNSEP